MLRLLWIMGIAVGIVTATHYFDIEIPLIERAKSYVDNSESLTLEARYTPEEIMETKKRELLGKEGRSFLSPSPTYYPYLLLDVKYLNGKETKEGVLFWSLVDGEMVINAETWEKTHGFHDAIEAGATSDDFKLINAVASGYHTKEKLQKTLHLNPEELERIIDSSQRKHLVIQQENEIRLHFQDPKILVTPQTKINEWLATKPFPYRDKTPKKYSKSQIERIAKNAFGADFTIRSTKEIYLPAAIIQVQNKDGSIQTSYWNLINGKRMNPIALGLKKESPLSGAAHLLQLGK